MYSLIWGKVQGDKEMQEWPLNIALSQQMGWGSWKFCRRVPSVKSGPRVSNLLMVNYQMLSFCRAQPIQLEKRQQTLPEGIRWARHCTGHQGGYKLASPSPTVHNRQMEWCGHPAAEGRRLGWDHRGGALIHPAGIREGFLRGSNKQAAARSFNQL